MKTLTTGKVGVAALAASLLVLAPLTACSAERTTAPEASVLESSRPAEAPEARQTAHTPGVEENIMGLCTMVEPSLSFWRTNSVRGARVSFNSALAEWALRNKVNVRSVVKNPDDIDIAMAKKCPEVWKETKLALATDSLSAVVLHL